MKQLATLLLAGTLGFFALCAPSRAESTATDIVQAYLAKGEIHQTEAVLHGV